MATSEPITPRQAVWEENRAMESRSFPAALHGAAFVSSEGKVYRLFAEDESPSLGETLQFDRFEYESELTEERDDFQSGPILPMTLRFFSDSIDSTTEAVEGIDSSPPSTLPLDEALRRLRAVEGTWGRRSEEPAVRIFDSMSQSATNRSRRVLGRTWTPKSNFEEKHTEENRQRSTIRWDEIVLRTAEEPFDDAAQTERRIIRLFETETSHGTPTTETIKSTSDHATRADKPKNVIGPFRQRVSAVEKPVRLPERGAKVTSEFRAAIVRSTDISLEILEQPVDKAPWLIGRPCPETEKTAAIQKETPVEKAQHKNVSVKETLFRQRPLIKKQTTLLSPGPPPPLTSVVELRVDAGVQQTVTPIPLIRVVMQSSRRRSGFVPRKETIRARPVEQCPENFVETEASEVIRTEFVNTVSELLEATAIHEILAAENPNVIEEWGPSLSNVDEVPSGISSMLRPFSVAFRWPTVCDALKKKAETQICSLADYLIALKEHRRKTICFHGFFPSEGCSTVLLCAVRELTDRGFNVLLVDGNGRNPELAKLLGVPAPMGNGERFALVDDRLELLLLIGNSSKTEGKSLKLSERVGFLKNSYDFILIDAGSLTEGEPLEKTLFWQETAADGVLLVINTKNRQPVNLEAVDARLRQHGIELLGVSENYV